MCSIPPDTRGSVTEHDTAALRANLIAWLKPALQLRRQSSERVSRADSGGNCPEGWKVLWSDGELLFVSAWGQLEGSTHMLSFFMVNICFSFPACVFSVNPVCTLLRSRLEIFLRLACWTCCFSPLTVFGSEFQSAWWGLVWVTRSFSLGAVQSKCDFWWILVQTSLSSCLSR